MAARAGPRPRRYTAFARSIPAAACIALRKAREFASKSVVYAIKAAIGEELGKTIHYNSADLIFNYANGSRIFVVGMKDEAQRQALRSINGDGSADFIWGEEANALTEDDHNELLARLPRQGCILAAIALHDQPGWPVPLD